MVGVFIPLVRCASIPHFHYAIGLTLRRDWSTSEDGWDPGDRLRILQYKNSETVPRIVMGDAAKNVSKEVKKAAWRD